MTYTAKSATAPSGTAGRLPLTPRDLLRMREFYQRCASLSPEAALLAVLATRLDGREEIEVHPGDLIEDVCQRLDWRDRADPPSPEVISAWLRRLGFERIGRDAQGVTYTIRWESVWQLDPREVSRDRVDLLNLSGAELLGLLVEEQGAFPAPRLWCPTCHRQEAALLGNWGSGLEVALPCSECGGPTERLNPSWLEKASVRVRGAIRDDRALLPKVKAEWEKLTDGAPWPALQEPFAWFTRVWANATRLRGRPPNPMVCYQLAHAVEALESAGVSQEQIAELFQEPDRERRQALFRRLPDRVHRFLGTDGPGIGVDLPSVNRKRLWEAVQWAHRQWTNPMARLRGERPFQVAGPRRVVAAPPPPTRSSDVPRSCPKCGSRALSAVAEGRLTRMGCSTCGWDAFISSNRAEGQQYTSA